MCWAEIKTLLDEVDPPNKTDSITINQELTLYVPKFNEEKDISILHSLIKTKP
jgi:hypothetical protein